jgi:hypothetical protein
VNTLNDKGYYTQEQITLQEMLDAYQGRAGRVALCILTGLTEPEGEVTPGIQAIIAQEIFILLSGASRSEYIRRMPRALAWAVRPDVSPELAIYAIESTRRARSMTIQKEIARLPQWKAFREKLGPILDEALA